MKSTTTRTARPTRPEQGTTATASRLGAPLAPTPADAPSGRPTVSFEADQSFELEPSELDGKTVRRFMNWKTRLLCDTMGPDGKLITDVYLTAHSTDFGSSPALDRQHNLGDLVGGFFSVNEFRRAVAALNSLADSLPDMATLTGDAPTTIRSAR